MTAMYINMMGEIASELGLVWNVIYDPRTFCPIHKMFTKDNVRYGIPTNLISNTTWYEFLASETGYIYDVSIKSVIRHAIIRTLNPGDDIFNPLRWNGTKTLIKQHRLKKHKFVNYNY